MSVVLFALNYWRIKAFSPGEKSQFEKKNGLKLFPKRQHFSQTVQSQIVIVLENNLKNTHLYIFSCLK